VSVRTINQWKLDHVEFSAPLKVAKLEADERGERSLYYRAVGYSYDAVKIFRDKGEAEAVIVHTANTFPPNTTACISGSRTDALVARHSDFDRLNCRLA
jgi:hypothetical protein